MAWRGRGCGVACPALRAAGYLPPVHGEVAVSLTLQAGHVKRLAHPAHDPNEAISHILPFRFPFERLYQRVIQAPGPQEHRTPTGTAPEDRNVRSVALG